MVAQMTDLVTQLNTGEVVDLLATPTGPWVPNVVLTLDMAYASDPSLSDLIDGEYRVLGKVTRFIPAGSNETLNLLRKTTLGDCIRRCWISSSSRSRKCRRCGSPGA